MGRPTSYNPGKHDDLVRIAAAGPYTDAEIAKKLRIGYSTMRLWLEQHPSFLAAHKEGRDELVSRVEHSGLYRRALGYDYEEVSVTTEAFAPIKRGSRKEAIFHRALRACKDDEMVTQVKVTRTMKHVVPDVGAAVFVTCNRRPKGYDPENPEAGWRHVQRIEHTGAGGGPIEHTDLTDKPDEAIIAEAEAIARRAAEAGVGGTGAAEA